jgi:SPP1 gp7 family putative phage head morphogenesis protein
MELKDKDVENIFSEIFPSLSDKVKKALSETLARARYFVSYQDLTRYIMNMLETHVGLSTEEKAKLQSMLEKIYKIEQAEFPIGIKLTIADERAINYALKLHDFYLGKFFQRDRELRLDVVKWMSNYYLEKGYPIGRGQEGIKKFLDEFGDYLTKRTESKARQIIDTSVNFLRNSARIRAMQKANIKKYRWDATNDRLTCKACRSMDGRVFEVADAVRVLDMLEGSEDPTLIKELRPIQTKPQIGPSSSLPTKSPPLHPLCRCRVVAFFEEVEWQTTVERPVWAKDTPIQRELEEEYKALTNEERVNKIKAHLGADWLRPVKGERGINAYEYSKKRLLDHFYKHGHELGYTTKDDYAKAVYDIIRRPKAVYIDRIKGETFYHFIKDKKIVITSDDTLKIITFYLYEENRWRSKARDGIIRIL